VGNLLYISGLIANTNEDPLKVVEGGVEEQTRQTLRNMEHILKVKFRVEEQTRQTLRNMKHILKVR